MKKGFTLIELLAVILILGVIALIAIPTVTNIIEDSKKQSYIRSAEGLLSSVDTKINIDMLKGEDINVAYNFKDGKLLNGELDLKGTMPEEGKVRVNNDGEVKFAIVYDKYCLTKSFTSDEINASELDENGCQLPENNSVMKAYTYFSNVTSKWETLSEAFYEPTYRDNIVKISFLYQENVPTNALISWDVSDTQDESIMAYLMPNGTKYDLYIISENNIYAPSALTFAFSSYGEVKEINFINYDTSNAVMTSSMFASCAKLKELDLTGFNTSKITTMSYMFAGTRLEKINLSSFDTSNVSNMDHMFSWSLNLEELDLSNFDTNKVTDMSGMFSDSLRLATIYIGEKWKTATTATNMFSNCGTEALTLK